MNQKLIKFVLIGWTTFFSSVVTLKIQEKDHAGIQHLPMPESILGNGITLYWYNISRNSKKLLNKVPIDSSIDVIGIHQQSHVKIIIHGFLSSCSLFEKDIIAQYLEKYPNLNIFCMDWSPHANPKDGLSGYENVVNNLEKYAGLIINSLKFIQPGKLSPSSFHLIGHSLGAHLAGIAGSLIHKQFGVKFNRITGLDPAGVSFDSVDSVDVKLDKTDADFVDITHTNAGQLGTVHNWGHVDFYFNDGKTQSQCRTRSNPLADMIEAVSGLCSHTSARTYFGKSIKEHLMACKCDSYTNFKNGHCKCRQEDTIVYGENCPTTARGKYFVHI